MAKIYDSVLEHVGNTPLVRLTRIGRNLDCELLAKCEFFNAGGSVKDRIGVRMIEDAERAGRIKPGDTLIEPTSGNTGIGLALVAAVKGYRLIVTMPEKMSREKVAVLEALGAHIIRTPTEAAWDSPDSHIGVAKRLEQELPNAHILDQYSNPSNPDAHEHGTGAELIAQCDGKIDMVVISAGTGGTITGVARALKRHNPECQIIGVDPEGSILAGPGPISSYKVEGIGYDFIPDVLDRSVVDRWIKTRDRESFIMARQLIAEEGLLVGGSSGSAVWAALQAAKDLKAGQRCVVLLPDSVRNYMTKFLDDQWMRDNGFFESTWQLKRVGELLDGKPRDVLTVSAGTSVGAAVKLLDKNGISQMPVIGESGMVLGLVTENGLLGHMMAENRNHSDPVAEVLDQNYEKVSLATPLGALQALFTRGGIALVVDKENGQEALKGVIAKIDLLSFLM